MKYADFVRQDRRLQILLILQAAAGYGASNYLLSHGLDAFAHQVSMDALRGDLAWLEEQGLVSLSTQDDATIARLTQRGLDCAEGRVVVPGVKRPKPE
jgi:Fe2+ or Zn2+ uptake regulation protein